MSQTPSSKFNFGPTSNAAPEQAAPVEPVAPSPAIANKDTQDTEPTPPIKIAAPVSTVTAKAKSKTNSAPQPSATEDTAPADENIEPPHPLVRNKLPQAAKISIILILSLILIVTLSIFFSLGDSRKEAKAYTSAIEKAQKQKRGNELNDDLSLNGLTLTLSELNAILNKASSIEDNQERGSLRSILAYVKGVDFDADPVIAKFITKSIMGDDETRIDLLKVVMANRRNPSNIGTLLGFANTTQNADASVAAINAAKANIDPSSPDENFSSFLDIINTSENSKIINAAERAASEIVLKSKNRNELNPLIISSYESATDDNKKYALLRLLGTTGTNKAGKVIIESLNAGDSALAGAAISALKKWPNSSLFDDLVKYIKNTQNLQLKNNAFSVAHRMISVTGKKKASKHLQKNLETLNSLASSDAQQFSIINRAATITEPWADKILATYISGSNKHLSARAKKARANAQKLKAKAGQ